MRRRYGQQEACRICGQDIEWSGAKKGWTDRGGSRGCAVYTGPDHEFVYPTSKHEPDIACMTKAEARAAYKKLPTTATPKEFLGGHGNWGLTEKEHEDATRLARILVGRGGR
jgi:hypothetical protein